MRKLNHIFSVPICIVTTTTLLLPGVSAKPVTSSNYIYSLDSENYEIEYKEKTLILRLKYPNLHNQIDNIKFISSNSNKSYTFTDNGSYFSLSLDEDLRLGVHHLLFNFRSDSDLKSKKFYSPVSVTSPTTSSQNIAVTSLNPLISVTNSGNVNRLNARFTLLNIADTITNIRLIDENNLRIGTLENTTSPNNVNFLLDSPLSSNTTYYVEYTLTNKDNGSRTIRIPFTYNSNSVRISPVSTNNLTYTATKNSDATVNLTLNLKDIANQNLNIFDARNIGVEYIPSQNQNGIVTVNNVPTNTLLRIEYKNSQGITQAMNFKTPNDNVNMETPIPFIKFVNASGLSLTAGKSISVPIVKDDLTKAGFDTSCNLKFVYFDEFGNEIALTDEKTISSSISQTNFNVNSNISNITSNSQVYIKASTATTHVLFPYNVSNISTSPQVVAFDIVKNSFSNDRLHLTFNPNSSILASGETFSSQDMLIINGKSTATLSNDKKSFYINIPKSEIINGTNTYTLIKNVSNGTPKYITGEFLINTTNINSNIESYIKTLSQVSNNSNELTLRLGLDNNLLISSLLASAKLTDEFGKTLKTQVSVKQSALNNQTIEVTINPSSQLISGMTYNLEINTGSETFMTSFIYGSNRTQDPNLLMTFANSSTFTLKNLSNLPGYSNYKFNLQIYDYYNKNDVLYENYPQTYNGEVFKSDSITRNLLNGKTFSDGYTYGVRITNSTTGETFEKTFVFRLSETNNSFNSSQTLIPSSSINYSNESVSFSYSLPQNKSITNVSCNVYNIKTSYRDGRIYLEDLIPNKLYKNLYLTLTFSDRTTQNIRLENFKSRASNTELKNYLSKVYSTVLTPINETDEYKIRYADENGFKYWYDLLYNQRITGSEFIFRIIDENEFNYVHQSTENKIRALYPILVNRNGDLNGVNYWVEEFKSLSQNLNSENLALKTIMYQMLSENEPQQLFKNLGIRI